MSNGNDAVFRHALEMADRDLADMTERAEKAEKELADLRADLAAWRRSGGPMRHMDRADAVVYAYVHDAPWHNYSAAKKVRVLEKELADLRAVVRLIAHTGFDRRPWPESLEAAYEQALFELREKAE